MAKPPTPPFHQTLNDARPEHRPGADTAAVRLVEVNRAGQPPPHGIRILSYAELQNRGIRFSRVWIAHLIKIGKFPRPVNLGSAHVGFVESEIDEWLAGLIRTRDEAGAQQPAPAE